MPSWVVCDLKSGRLFQDSDSCGHGMARVGGRGDHPWFGRNMSRRVGPSFRRPRRGFWRCERWCPLVARDGHAPRTGALRRTGHEHRERRHLLQLATLAQQPAFFVATRPPARTVQPAEGELWPAWRPRNSQVTARAGFLGMRFMRLERGTGTISAMRRGEPGCHAVSGRFSYLVRESHCYGVRRRQDEVPACAQGRTGNVSVAVHGSSVPRSEAAHLLHTVHRSHSVC